MTFIHFGERGVVTIQVPETYEQVTQDIAQQLLTDMQSSKGRLPQTHWDDRLLGWAIANPCLQTQLFRLIDVLPCLTDKTDIAQHLQEYLGDPTVDLPQPLQQLLRFAKPQSIPGQVAATTITTAVTTLAQRFIAGETLPSVLKTLTHLRQQGLTFALDMLGEAVITEPEAQGYLQGYLKLMRQLAEASKQWPPIPALDQIEDLPKTQVTVKLTAFYSQFDPLDVEGSKAQVRDRIRTLLRHAGNLGVAVHFDMEQFIYKDVTLAILKELLLESEFLERTDIGLTLQAYLRDSDQDLQDLIAWAQQRGAPITVRLVKGAYWDQETIKAIQHNWPQPVFNQKVETDASFERLTERLLTHHECLYAAIGSHNVRSQARAIAIANALKIPPRRFELQVLYGMADNLAQAMAAQGHRVRVYCPYGQLLPGMAYLIRRLLENTANSSFLRQRFETPDIETLLLSPHESSRLPATNNGQRSIETLKPRSSFINVPDSDFSQVSARHQAQQALQQVRQQLGQTYWPLIGGQAISTTPVQASVNPSHPTECVGQVGQVSIELAEQAVVAAKAAVRGWQQTPAHERATLLRRAADLMGQRRYELAAWIVLEVGKVLREADAEISEAIDFCRFYADEMERLALGHRRDLPGETNHTLYRGRGIAVVISPWNFPLAIATGMTVAALVAGNCVLLKPAGPASVVAAKLTEILLAAGIPAGVFQYLPGSGAEIGAYLTRHPQVQMITFTGSQGVGSQIYADAAVLRPGQHHLKRVIAEMGGKNAIIIDESADLDRAVADVVASAFGYSGQKCSACSRAIVIESVYDTFVNRLVEAVRSLNIGDASKPSTQVGPVIDVKARDRIREYIAKGKEEATVAIEMPSPEPGYFIGPVVFTDVKPEATIAQEEIFGPVLAVIKAKNFDDAIDIANGTNYGLTGGLHSRTPSHIDRAKAEFEVGNLYINRGITGAIVSRQPFGGFKLSGVGSKAGGPDYLLQFLEPRTVTENIQRQGFAPIEGVE